jgi:predicted transcriptional regulator
MTIAQVRDILEARVLSGEELLRSEVHSACGSDLMSDVLAFVKDQSVLLTGLLNLQVVRTAEMMDMKCIVFVRGKVPDEAILSLAAARDMVVMSTDFRMYNACGRLYAAGLVGLEGAR